MARVIMERKIVIEVTDASWDKMTDKDINNLLDQADAVLTYAERYVEDNLRGTKPAVFVRTED